MTLIVSTILLFFANAQECFDSESVKFPEWILPEQCDSSQDQICVQGTSFDSTVVDKFTTVVTMQDKDWMGVGGSMQTNMWVEKCQYTDTSHAFIGLFDFEFNMWHWARFLCNAMSTDAIAQEYTNNRLVGIFTGDQEGESKTYVGWFNRNTGMVKDLKAFTTSNNILISQPQITTMNQNIYLALKDSNIGSSAQNSPLFVLKFEEENDSILMEIQSINGYFTSIVADSSTNADRVVVAGSNTTDQRGFAGIVELDGSIVASTSMFSFIPTYDAYTLPVENSDSLGIYPQVSQLAMENDILYGAVEVPTNINQIAGYQSFFMHDWNDNSQDMCNNIQVGEGFELPTVLAIKVDSIDSLVLHAILQSGSIDEGSLDKSSFQRFYLLLTFGETVHQIHQLDSSAGFMYAASFKTGSEEQDIYGRNSVSFNGYQAYMVGEAADYQKVDGSYFQWPQFKPIITSSWVSSRVLSTSASLLDSDVTSLHNIDGSSVIFQQNDAEVSDVTITSLNEQDFFDNRMVVHFNFDVQRQYLKQNDGALGFSYPYSATITPPEDIDQQYYILGEVWDSNNAVYFDTDSASDFFSGCTNTDDTNFKFFYLVNDNGISEQVGSGYTTPLLVRQGELNKWNLIYSSLSALQGQDLTLEFQVQTPGSNPSYHNFNMLATLLENRECWLNSYSGGNSYSATFYFEDEQASYTIPFELTMLQSESSAGYNSCQTDAYKAALVSHSFSVSPDSSTIAVSIEGDQVSWVAAEGASVSSDTVYTISILTELSERGRHPSYYNSVQYTVQITVKAGSSQSATCFSAPYKGSNKEDYLLSRNGAAFEYESGEWPIVFNMDEEIQVLCPSVKVDQNLDCIGFVSCSITLDTSLFGQTFDSIYYNAIFENGNESSEENIELFFDDLSAYQFDTSQYESSNDPQVQKVTFSPNNPKNAGYAMLQVSITESYGGTENTQYFNLMLQVTVDCTTQELTDWQSVLDSPVTASSYSLNSPTSFTLSHLLYEETCEFTDYPDMACSWSGFIHPLDSVWKEICGRATIGHGSMADFVTLTAIDDDTSQLEINPTDSAHVGMHSFALEFTNPNSPSAGARYSVVHIEVTAECSASNFSLQTDSTDFDGTDTWTLPEAVTGSSLSYGAIWANIELQDSLYTDVCALTLTITSTTITFLHVSIENGVAFEYCSDENGTCSFVGSQVVRYASNTDPRLYYDLELTDGTSCSNSIFTDPHGGHEKSCHLKSSSDTVSSLVIVPDSSLPVGQTATEYFELTGSALATSDYATNTISGAIFPQTMHAEYPGDLCQDEYEALSSIAITLLETKYNSELHYQYIDTWGTEIMLNWNLIYAFTFEKPDFGTYTGSCDTDITSMTFDMPEYVVPLSDFLDGTKTYQGCSDPSQTCSYETTLSFDVNDEIYLIINLDKVRYIDSTPYTMQFCFGTDCDLTGALEYSLVSTDPIDNDEFCEGIPFQQALDDEVITVLASSSTVVTLNIDMELDVDGVDSWSQVCSYADWTLVPESVAEVLPSYLTLTISSNALTFDATGTTYATGCPYPVELVGVDGIAATLPQETWQVVDQDGRLETFSFQLSFLCEDIPWDSLTVLEYSLRALEHLAIEVPTSKICLSDDQLEDETRLSWESLCPFDSIDLANTDDINFLSQSSAPGSAILSMYADKVSDLSGSSSGLTQGNYEFYFEQMPAYTSGSQTKIEVSVFRPICEDIPYVTDEDDIIVALGESIDYDLDAKGLLVKVDDSEGVSWSNSIACPGVPLVSVLDSNLLEITSASDVSFVGDADIGSYILTFAPTLTKHVGQGNYAKILTLVYTQDEYDDSLNNLGSTVDQYQELQINVTIDCSLKRFAELAAGADIELEQQVVIFTHFQLSLASFYDFDGQNWTSVCGYANIYTLNSWYLQSGGFLDTNTDKNDFNFFTATEFIANFLPQDVQLISTEQEIVLYFEGLRYGLSEEEVALGVMPSTSQETYVAPNSFKLQLAIVECSISEFEYEYEQNTVYHQILYDQAQIVKFKYKDFQFKTNCNVKPDIKLELTNGNGSIVGSCSENKNERGDCKAGNKLKWITKYPSDQGLDLLVQPTTIADAQLSSGTNDLVVEATASSEFFSQSKFIKVYFRIQVSDLCPQASFSTHNFPQQTLIIGMKSSVALERLPMDIDSQINNSADVQVCGPQRFSISESKIVDISQDSQVGVYLIDVPDGLEEQVLRLQILVWTIDYSQVQATAYEWAVNLVQDTCLTDALELPVNLNEAEVFFTYKVEGKNLLSPVYLNPFKYQQSPSYCSERPLKTLLLLNYNGTCSAIDQTVLNQFSPETMSLLYEDSQWRIEFVPHSQSQYTGESYKLTLATMSADSGVQMEHCFDFEIVMAESETHQYDYYNYVQAIINDKMNSDEPFESYQEISFFVDKFRGVGNRLPSIDSQQVTSEQDRMIMHSQKVNPDSQLTVKFPTKIEEYLSFNEMDCNQKAKFADGFSLRIISRDPLNQIQVPIVGCSGYEERRLRADAQNKLNFRWEDYAETDYSLLDNASDEAEFLQANATVVGISTESIVFNISFSEPLQLSKSVSSPDYLEVALQAFSNPFFSRDQFVPPRSQTVVSEIAKQTPNKDDGGSILKQVGEIVWGQLILAIILQQVFKKTLSSILPLYFTLQFMTILKDFNDEQLIDLPYNVQEMLTSLIEPMEITPQKEEIKNKLVDAFENTALGNLVSSLISKEAFMEYYNAGGLIILFFLLFLGVITPIMLCLYGLVSYSKDNCQPGCCRWIARQLFAKIDSSLLFRSQIKVIQVTFLKFVFSSKLGHMMGSNFDVFESNFSGTYAYLYVLSVLFLSLLLVLPGRKALSRASVKKRIGSFYEQLQVHSTSSLLYPFLFFLRRILFVTTFYIEASLAFRLQLLVVQSLVMIYYTFAHQPKKHWWDNYIDFYNELAILLAVCCLLVFSNDVLEESQKVRAGAIFNNMVMLPLLLVNFSWFIIASVFKGIHNGRKRQEKALLRMIDAVKTIHEEKRLRSFQAIVKYPVNKMMNPFAHALRRQAVNRWRRKEQQQRLVHNKVGNCQLADLITNRENLMNNNEQRTQAFQSVIPLQVGFAYQSASESESWQTETELSQKQMQNDQLLLIDTESEQAKKTIQDFSVQYEPRVVKCSDSSEKTPLSQQSEFESLSERAEKREGVKINDFQSVSNNWNQEGNLNSDLHLDFTQTNKNRENNLDKQTKQTTEVLGQNEMLRQEEKNAKMKKLEAQWLKNIKGNTNFQ